MSCPDRMVHIVMWKLLDSAQGHSAAENAARLKAALETMRGRIPGMSVLEVGVDTRRRANSYDVVLVSMFDDMESLEAYHDHPDHNAVQPLIQAVRSQSIVVDYPARAACAEVLAASFAGG
jgi:hypothetical protein